MEIENIISKVHEMLRHHEDYKDDDELAVQYILLDKDNKINEIVCYGNENLISVDPNTFDIHEIADYAFTYDTDVFSELQNGKKIGYMTPSCHYNIWNQVNDWYPEDIDNIEGMKLYFDYCKNNSITKEYIDKEMQLNVPDVVTRIKMDELIPIMEKKAKEEIKKVLFVLVDKNNPDIITIHAELSDSKVLVSSFSKNKNIENHLTDKWDFAYELWLLKELNNNQRIGYMPMEIHREVWKGFNNFNSAPNYSDVKQYIEYCKNNGIKKEYFYPEQYRNIPNIMSYYEPEKGYYEADNNTMMMSRDVFDKRNERFYLTFVLGYDLLNNMISNSKAPECDISYDFCYMIADDFLNSEAYKDTSKSSYEMLEIWVNENIKDIQLKYNDYIGLDPNLSRTLDNGIYVMDLGYRKEQPIALLEKTNGDNKEYIVAFNYKIEDNKIEWAYGYYYNDNITKSKEDFKKVISGGNLDSTFKYVEKEER